MGARIQALETMRRSSQACQRALDDSVVQGLQDDGSPVSSPKSPDVSVGSDVVETGGSDGFKTGGGCRKSDRRYEPYLKLQVPGCGDASNDFARHCEHVD